MLKKIISGGQTGADQAALDVAIKFNIPHGGWIPKGRKTEDGPLPVWYHLVEMDSSDYKERTKQNIIDSHGTLIISRGKLTGGSKLTQSYAKVIGRPCIYLDLMANEDFESAVFLKSFVLENQIEILNVAGPRLSHHPWIYDDVKTILEALLYLLFLDTHQDMVLAPDTRPQVLREEFPAKLDDAVSLIKEDLSFKTKTFLARLEQNQIQKPYFLLLESIRYRVGFDHENQLLMEDCSKFFNMTGATIEDAVMAIIKQLKQQLEKEYSLRVVK
ncbi:MAG: putative molybdenum carrier protein [Desulfobacula sp.]|nr:putative molybdenum carrier protein [Desulfobacula sp.]